VTAERTGGHFGLNGERLIVDNLESALQEDRQREEELLLELHHLGRMREIKTQLVRLARELVAEDEKWHRTRIGLQPVSRAEEDEPPPLSIVLDDVAEEEELGI
jgi:hypothetical protein